MPPKRGNGGDDEERLSNVTTPKRRLTGKELRFFIEKRGQHVGYVTRGQTHEGQPVFASMEGISQVKLHLDGETRISAQQVDWFESSDEELLRSRLRILYKKAYGFYLAALKGLFCEFEFFEMREYPQALDVGYALMRHYYLIPRHSGVFPAERGLISKTFNKDLERAEDLLNKLIAAFPEEKESLNPLSIARAAGYYTKFKNRFPHELQGFAIDSRYEIYLIKASKKFWMETINQHTDSNKEYSDEDKSEDKSERRPKRRRKTSAQTPRLFTSSASNPEAAFARDYRMDDIPQYLTEERLSKYKAVVKNPWGVKRLHALSPVFSTIPGDIRISDGVREHYAPNASELTLKLLTPTLQQTALNEIYTFCHPPLFTKYFEEVWNKFSGGEQPAFPEGGFPRPEDGASVMDSVQGILVRTYLRYVNNKMSASIKHPETFIKWTEAVDYCLDNNLLVISDNELAIWKTQRPYMLNRRLRSYGDGDDW